MASTRSEADLEEAVCNLVRTLHKLMKESGAGWVHWDQVARAQTGATAAATQLSGLAKLPQYEQLFYTTRANTMVKLSPEGFVFYSTLAPEKVSRLGIVANAIIEYARSLRPIRLAIMAVSTVAPVGSKVVQAVHVDLTDEILPSETPVLVCPDNGSSIQGKLVGQEQDGGVVYVALDCELLPANLPATLKIDRAHLLSELANQLQTLQDFPERMGALFQEMTGVPVLAHGNSAVVGQQLAALPIPWTRCLWGPPGAGKTYGLGEFVAHLLEHEPKGRILIVAPSNRAVDVAIKQLRVRLDSHKLQSLITQRKILRFGYPRHPEVIELPQLLGPGHLDQLSKQVKEMSLRLNEAEKGRADNATVATLRAELLAAQEKVKQAVDMHVQQCSVVATTTTLAYVAASPIGKHIWDTIIVDEATMVSPAICTFLASKAKSRLLFAGDPRQLGPVYEENGSTSENARFWLGKDLFEASRISLGPKENHRLKLEDARLTRITAQRRCGAAIWENVAHLYPQVTEEADANRVRTLANLPPCPGKSVVVLDTSGSNAKCELSHGSWQNTFTAELAMEVAGTVASEVPTDKFSIAIISPYRAQIRLLRNWIREERKADVTPFKQLVLEAGTVHQFQGSEADIVIFDMVDGPGRSRVGKLLRDDTGIRLTNVAITRARGKVVIIADKQWCAKSDLAASNSLLARLILGKTTVEHIHVAPPHVSTHVQFTDEDKTESPIETRLLVAMRNHAVLQTVQMQYEIVNDHHVLVSRADFAFPQIKYAVYCDGRQWHLQKDRWQRDLRQRNELAALGWMFSVFSGRQINDSADACARQIVETYQRRCSESR